MNKQELITYRMAQPGDIAFIFSAWLRGLRYGNKKFKSVPSRLYFTEMHKMIEIVLKHRDTVVNVACLISDPDTILGYSVTSPYTLHWVFVKKAWRGIGIGTDLVPRDIKVLTNVTELIRPALEANKGITVHQMCPINLTTYLR